MKHFQVTISVAAVLAAFVVACSSESGSGSSSGSGSGSGSGSSKCGATFTTSNTTCSQAQLDDYDHCRTDQCGSEIDSCKPTCQSQTDCINACACGDTACIGKCVPSADCKTCLQGAAKCMVGKCPAPACLSDKPTGGGSGSDAGTHTSTGADAGTGGGTGTGTGDSGTATSGGSCADLAVCCTAIPSSDFDHDTCNYTVSKGVESTCSSELKYYRDQGKC